MKKTDAHSFEGLARIGHPIKQKNNLLWDAHNIRLTTRNGKDSLLSITNERSTTELCSFPGEQYVGHVQAGKYLVLFNHAKDDSYDVIYRIELHNNIKAEEVKKIILFKGTSLNLNPDYPIHGVSVQDFQTVFKVFWTDNLNVVKHIDILKPERLGAAYDDSIGYTKTYGEYSDFCIVNSLEFTETCSVTINYDSGMFPASVVQYVLTYYNEYEMETNPFWYSPLMYASYADRGGSPEDTIACNFTINVKGVNSKYQYLRIYSIVRTSLNTTPTVKVVNDIAIEDKWEISYTDDNTTGYTIDPNELLLKQYNSVIAKTLAVKDGTLFMGNVKYQRTSLYNKSLGIVTEDFKLNNPDQPITNQYHEVLVHPNILTENDYTCQLSTNTSGFQYNETYRLGVRFITAQGEFSDPIWVGDVKNEKPPYLAYKTVQNQKNYYITKGEFYVNFSEELIKKLSAVGYVGVQPLYVIPKLSDRHVIAQGLLNPTVYNILDRKVNHNIESQASWFLRPDCPEYYIYDPKYTAAYGSQYHKNDFDFTGVYTDNGAYVANCHDWTLAIGNGHNVEIQGMNTFWNATTDTAKTIEYYTGDKNAFLNNDWTLAETAESNVVLSAASTMTGSLYCGESSFVPVTRKISLSTSMSGYNTYYAVDRSIQTFNSPDFENSDIVNLVNSNPKLDVEWLGSYDFYKNYGMFEIETLSSLATSLALGSLNTKQDDMYGSRSMVSGTFYNDALLKTDISCYTKWGDDDTIGCYNYMVYPFSQGDSVTNAISAVQDQNAYNKPKRITVFNQKLSKTTVKLNKLISSELPNLTGCKVFNSEDVEYIKIKKGTEDASTDTTFKYYGNLDTQYAQGEAPWYNHVITPYSLTPSDRKTYIWCNDLEDPPTKYWGTGKLPSNNNYISYFEGTMDGLLHNVAVPNEFVKFQHFAMDNLKENIINLSVSTNLDKNSVCEILDSEYKGNTYTRGVFFQKMIGSLLYCTNETRMIMNLQIAVDSTDTYAGNTAQIKFEDVGHEVHLFAISSYGPRKLFRYSDKDDSTSTRDVDYSYWGEFLAQSVGFTGFIILTEDYSYVNTSITDASKNTFKLPKGTVFKVTFDTNGWFLLGNWRDEQSTENFSKFRYRKDCRMSWHTNPEWGIKKVYNWNSYAYCLDGYRDAQTFISPNNSLVNHLNPHVTKGIKIRYKSLPHLVLSFDEALPWACTSASVDNNYIKTHGYNFAINLVQDPVNPYGGNSLQALQNNIWIPAGDVRSFIDHGYVVWDRGDTWYQQYDCLRVYPYSLDDTVNQIIDVCAFYVESKINLDGRYDKNRLLCSSALIPENYNKINPVYSQLDNFFTGNIKTELYYQTESYPTQLTWTSPRVATSKVDSWLSSFNMLSSTDIDSSKGQITALCTYNDDLLCFQENSFGKVLYNERVQINTEDNTPIEIANSGKVQGIKAISTHVSCQDLFALTTSEKGVYFIDRNTGTFYRYNQEGLVDLNLTLGNYYWPKEHNQYADWMFDSENNPNGFRCFYDPTYKDVYFCHGKNGKIDYEHALCYSELMEQFTSQLSYGGSVMTSYEGNLYAIAEDPTTISSDLKLWQCFTGKTAEGVDSYNQIFNKERPFDFTFISVGEDTASKTFDTIEFKMDAYLNGQLEDTEPNPSGRDPKWYYMERHSENDTFAKPLTYIEVSNEYQDSGKVKLNDSTLRKKYRVWRLMMPRVRKRERLVNPWVKITVGNDSPGTRSVIIHDLNVNYTI